MATLSSFGDVIVVTHGQDSRQMYDEMTQGVPPEDLWIDATSIWHYGPDEIRFRAVQASCWWLRKD